MATVVDLTSAKNILQQCSFSKLGTKSVEAPFFIPDLEKKEIADDLVNKANEDNMKDNTIILAVGDKVNLSTELLHVYMLLDSNDREFTYHTFTFFPHHGIKETSGNIRKKQPTASVRCGNISPRSGTRCSAIMGS